MTLVTKPWESICETRYNLKLDIVISEKKNAKKVRKSKVDRYEPTFSKVICPMNYKDMLLYSGTRNEFLML